MREQQHAVACSLQHGIDRHAGQRAVAGQALQASLKLQQPCHARKPPALRVLHAHAPRARSAHLAAGQCSTPGQRRSCPWRLRQAWQRWRWRCTGWWRPSDMSMLRPAALGQSSAARGRQTSASTRKERLSRRGAVSARAPAARSARQAAGPARASAIRSAHAHWPGMQTALRTHGM